MFRLHAHHFLSISLYVCVRVYVCSHIFPDYDPAWMSLFLALSSNISEYVPTDGIVPHPPASDNLLRLQRAVTAAWPPHLPPPFLFGNSSFGSRLYRQPSYHRLRQELPLAKSDRVGGGHSVMAAKGVLISGNAGTGKVHQPSCVCEVSCSCRLPRLTHSFLCCRLLRICRATFCWIMPMNCCGLVWALVRR